MIHLTTASLFFLAIGVFTSVTIVSGYQILFAAPLIYYSYFAFKNNQAKLPKSAYFLIAFSIIAIIGLILNIDLVPKPSKNFSRIKYFLYGVGGIFVLRAWIHEVSGKVKRILFSTFCLSIIIAGLFSIWDVCVNHSSRAHGLTESMRYGYASGMILLTLLSTIIHSSKISWADTRFAKAAFVIGFIGMNLTFTRGALLGFLCGLPFVFYFKNPKLAFKVGAGAFLIVLILAGFNQFGTKEKHSIRYLQNKSNKSDGIRRSIWKAAVIAISEKPILGWGLSNFHTQLKRIKEEHDLEYKQYADAHCHNLYLEILTGTGFVGFFCFLGWLACWAFEVWNSNLTVKLLVFPFGIAFTISSFFEVTFNANNSAMLFMIYSMCFSDCFLSKNDDIRNSTL